MIFINDSCKVCLLFSDVTIRADLLENIPSISHFCHDNSSLFTNAAESPISDFILPFVLKYVKDGHNQVCKACFSQS